jgi:hypothetical protein
MSMMYIFKHALETGSSKNISIFLSDIRITIAGRVEGKRNQQAIGLF